MNKLLRLCGRQTILLFFLAGVIACTIPGLGGAPTPVASNPGPVVTISYPAAGQKLEVGREIQVQSTSVDAEGIARVELLVDGQVTRIDANAQPQPNAPFIVVQPWTPAGTGSHVIQVRAYDTADSASESVPVSVEIVLTAQVVGGTPTPVPVTNTPTVTPAPLAPTLPAPPATSSPEPDLPTPTLPPPALPTSTPTPGTFAPTGLEPVERFYDIWDEVGGGSSRLGYPTAAEIGGRNFARQYFERGLMYWWDSPEGPDLIWVLDSAAADLTTGTNWNRYPDNWTDDRDVFTCNQARQNGDKGPLRGFGKIWCEQPELQRRLGNPREGEAGSGGNPPFSRVQFFQGGVMLYNPLNAEIYVLLAQGDWQRFDY